MYALNITQEDYEKISLKEDLCEELVNYLYSAESKKKFMLNFQDQRRIDDYYTIEFEHDYKENKWKLCNRPSNSSWKIKTDDSIKLTDIFWDTKSYQSLRIVFKDLDLIKLDIVQQIQETSIRIDSDEEMKYDNSSLTLSDCLYNYLDSEIIPKEQGYKCNKWKNQTAAVKRIVFTKPPKYLMISLNRFETIYGYGEYELSK